MEGYWKFIQARIAALLFYRSLESRAFFVIDLPACILVLRIFMENFAKQLVVYEGTFEWPGSNRKCVRHRL